MRGFEIKFRDVTQPMRLQLSNAQFTFRDAGVGRNSPPKTIDFYRASDGTPAARIPAANVESITFIHDTEP